MPVRWHLRDWFRGRVQVCRCDPHASEVGCYTPGKAIVDRYARSTQDSAYRQLRQLHLQPFPADCRRQRRYDLCIHVCFAASLRLCRPIWLVSPAAAPEVVFNDELTWDELRQRIARGWYHNIVISPGPGTPHCAADIGKHLLSLLQEFPTPFTCPSAAASMCHVQDYLCCCRHLQAATGSRLAAPSARSVSWHASLGCVSWC